jgi:hypothetical protein
MAFLLQLLLSAQADPGCKTPRAGGRHVAVAFFGAAMVTSRQQLGNPVPTLPHMTEAVNLTRPFG